MCFKMFIGLNLTIFLVLCLKLVMALKKNIRPVMLDYLAAMYVTCNMFLMHCFDFSKSNNDFSFQKVHFLKIKIIKTAEKEPY